MNITVKGKGMDVGDALRSHITTALSEHLTRYFDRSLEAHVTVAKGAAGFEVNLALHVPEQILAAHGEAAKAYGAYDAAAIKLFAQVKKHKSRVRDHHKENGGKYAGMAEGAVSA